MYTFIPLLALAGLSASAPSSTLEKPQPDLSEPCIYPDDYSWCSNGEMMACHKGFVTGLQKRCAVKRNELASLCLNYGARWCGDDGVYLVCQNGVPVATTTKCGIMKREVGSVCDDDGATWCQDYKILTCANHRVERTGAGCDSTQSHGPDEHQRPEGEPKYDPHHKGPENNATEKRGEGGGIPEWHRPVDDDGQHASNETEHDGPPGPPGQRPGDGEGYGNGPGKGEGHGPDGHGPGGHGPQANGTRPHGPPDTPGYEHTPDKAHGHHPPYGFPNGTEPHPPSPTGTPGGSPTGTPGGPGEHGPEGGRPEGHGPGGHGSNGAEPLPTPTENYKPDAYANKDRKRRIGDERYELLDREHGPLGIPIEDGDGGE